MAHRRSAYTVPELRARAGRVALGAWTEQRGEDLEVSSVFAAASAGRFAVWTHSDVFRLERSVSF